MQKSNGHLLKAYNTTTGTKQSYMLTVNIIFDPFMTVIDQYVPKSCTYPIAIYMLVSRIFNTFLIISYYFIVS